MTPPPARPSEKAAAVLASVLGGLFIMGSVSAALVAAVALLSAAGDEHGLGSVLALAALVTAAGGVMIGVGFLLLGRAMARGRTWGAMAAVPLLAVAGLGVGAQPAAWALRGEHAPLALAGLAVAGLLLAGSGLALASLISRNGATQPPSPMPDRRRTG